MDHFAGLDVSVKETSICIVDDAGKIVREVKVASEPEADRNDARGIAQMMRARSCGKRGWRVSLKLCCRF